MSPAVLRADEVGATAPEDAPLVRPRNRRAPVRAEHRLGGAHLDLLPLARPPRMAQGGERRERQLQTGVELRLMPRHAQGLALGVARDRPVPAQGVVGQLITRPAGVGAAPSEVIGVRHDDRGVAKPRQGEERVRLDLGEGKVRDYEVEEGRETGQGREQLAPVQRFRRAVPRLPRRRYAGDRPAASRPRGERPSATTSSARRGRQGDARRTRPQRRARG